MEKKLLNALEEMEGAKFESLDQARQKYSGLEIFDFWLEYEGVSGYGESILEVVNALRMDRAYCKEKSAEVKRQILQALACEEISCKTLQQALQQYSADVLFDIWCKYEGIGGHRTCILDALKELGLFASKPATEAVIKELSLVEANPEQEEMARKLNTDEAARNAKLAQERLRMLRLINNEVPQKEDLCELRRLHEQALAAYMRWVRLYGEPECEARGCHCG